MNDIKVSYIGDLAYTFRLLNVVDGWVKVTPEGEVPATREESALLEEIKRLDKKADDEYFRGYHAYETEILTGKSGFWEA